MHRLTRNVYFCMGHIPKIWNYFPMLSVMQEDHSEQMTKEGGDSPGFLEPSS